MFGSAAPWDLFYFDSAGRGGGKILFGPLPHRSGRAGFSLFPGFPVIDGPKNEMVEEKAARRQKKFDYPFFET